MLSVLGLLGHIVLAFSISFLLNSQLKIYSSGIITNAFYFFSILELIIDFQLVYVLAEPVSFVLT